MRKTIEKLITALLVILILFNFVYSNYVPVYGAVEDVVNVLINLLGGVVGIFTWIPRLIAMAIGLAANVLTAQVAYMDGATTGNDSFIGRITITPFEIFFNKVQILDVNFLETSVGGTTGIIRTAVAKWYYIVRLIAIAILMLILLYVGIRMALSSVASEKASYKRSLVDWVVSLALVFVLHYIIMFVVNANSAIVNALEKVTVNDGVGDAIMNIATTSLGASWEAVASTVVYCMIVFQTFVFLIKYIKRMLTVGFLIIISPLISITYSIDKMGDSKAQALNTWLKEFVYNVLIQPFHCIMYMAFVDTAFGILSRGDTSSFWSMLPFSMSNGIANAILAILCIKFIDDGEKIVRKIFGFDQASSLNAMDMAGMATAFGNNSQKIAGAAVGMKKGINFAKEKGLMSSMKKDLNAIRDRKAISSKSKELMNKNPGMTKGEAKREAKNIVTTARAEREKTKKQNSINEKARRKSAKREEKIDAQMRKTLGEAGYERLRQGQDTPEGKAAFEAAHAEAAKKVDQRANRGKTITGAIGNAWNSNTGKYIRKTMVPAGIGLALGGMALGGTNAFGAWNIGKTGFETAKALNKNSTKTIANEASKQVPDVSNKDEADDYMDTTIQKGENGAYDNKSDETKDLIKELREVLRAMGQEGRLNNITSSISKEMLENPDSFSLNSILSKIVGPENAQNADLQNAARAFADHKQEGYFYQQYQNAMNMGISDETFKEVVKSRLDYSNSETNGEGSNNSDTGSGSETITVENVITHLQKSENIEEVISKIDSSEFDAILPRIEDRIAELKRETEQTKEVTSEIDKLTRAANSITQKNA